MPDLHYQVRPISDRTWLRPPGQRTRSQFTAPWRKARLLLAGELAALNAQRVVLEMDVRERDIRVDGQVRADARPATSAVVLAFESAKLGPLQYRCDVYDDVNWTAGQDRQQPWQHNVRAIAMTLEALRAVDRYGATTRGEQYRGFLAIEGGTGQTGGGMTTDVALQIIETEADMDWPAGRDAVTIKNWLTVARKRSHPDRNNGDHSRWDAVEAARQVLERNGML